MNGKVKWYDATRGYGFINHDEGGEIFFHRTSVHEHKPLGPGEPVTFEVQPSDKGPRAEKVKRVNQLAQQLDRGK